MPRIVARQCPYTKRIFKNSNNYSKHLKKIRKVIHLKISLKKEIKEICSRMKTETSLIKYLRLSVHLCNHHEVSRELEEFCRHRCTITDYMLTRWIAQLSKVEIEFKQCENLGDEFRFNDWYPWDYYSTLRFYGITGIHATSSLWNTSVIRIDDEGIPPKIKEQFEILKCQYILQSDPGEMNDYKFSKFLHEHEFV